MKSFRKLNIGICRLIDDLRNELHKRIDLIRIDDLKGNFDFLNEILKKSVKI